MHSYPQAPYSSKTLTVPASITDLKAYLSQHGRDIGSLVFEPGSTLTRLQDQTFADCERLRSICLPASVEVLTEDSFAAASFFGHLFVEDLSFETGSKLRVLERGALSLLWYLKELSLPASLEVIEIPCFPIPWREAQPIKVEIESGNRFFKVNNDFLMDFRGVSLLRYFGCETKIQLSDDIETIGPYCFASTVTLFSVQCSARSRLRSIGERAFEGCRQLRTMTVPAPVTVLGQYCFLDCGALGRVSFAPKALLVELEEGVFGNCRHLKPIVFPPSVERIGAHCFYGCVVCSNVTFSAPSHLRDLFSLPPDVICGPIDLPDSVEVVRPEKTW
jgi:hypothetical protein